MQITTVGLDLAKRVFQVHAVDASGEVVVRKALRRSQVLPFFTKLPPCLIGMEACGTSHHWARELTKLGHAVRMMPPAYVKPYVKRGKNDAVDAEAICEAVTRPTMRFVAMKSAEQQAALSLHRTRNLLVKQRTQLVNMIRGLLAEFGIDVPEGLERALGLARQIAAKEATPDVPLMAMQILGLLCGQVLDTHVRLQSIDRSILALQELTRLHGVYRPFLASARSVQQHWRLRLPIQASSVRVESLPPGWGSHPRKTRAAVRTGSAASPRWVTGI
jgi:transposase